MIFCITNIQIKIITLLVMNLKYQIHMQSISVQNKCINIPLRIFVQNQNNQSQMFLLHLHIQQEVLKYQKQININLIQTVPHYGYQQPQTNNYNTFNIDLNPFRKQVKNVVSCVICKQWYQLDNLESHMEKHKKNIVQLKKSLIVEKVQQRYLSNNDALIKKIIIAPQEQYSKPVENTYTIKKIKNTYKQTQPESKYVSIVTQQQKNQSKTQQAQKINIESFDSMELPQGQYKRKLTYRPINNQPKNTRKSIASNRK